MHTTNYRKFKGKIENYVNKSNNLLESKIDHAFSILQKWKNGKGDRQITLEKLSVSEVVVDEVNRTCMTLCQTDWLLLERGAAFVCCDP